MKKFFTKNVIKYCLFIAISLLANKQIAAQTTLYYDGTGPLNDVSNWGINTDGTGGNTGITDFTGNSFTYIIQNATNIVFNSGTWTISGTGSKAVLGNPTYATPATPSAAITLTIAAGNSIVATPQLFEVSIPSSGNHKIIYQNNTALSLGAVNDSNLELVFDGANITTTTTRTYGNVSLINGATIDMSGVSTVFNNLTVDAGCTLSGPIGSSSQYIAIKTGGAVVINGTFRAGRQGSVASGAPGGLYTVGVTIPVTPVNTNATLLFQSSTNPPNITLGSSSTIDYYRGTSGQTGTQGVAPLAYANLTLSNSTTASDKTFADGTVSVSGTFTINLTGAAGITTPNASKTINILPTGRLIINSATTFNMGGRVTFQSDATGTASIGTLATGAAITGNVNLQQFIPAGFRKYRFLSHPFTTSQALSQITDNIDITGNTAGTTGQPGQTLGAGFTSTSTNNPSAYFFNTANADGNGTGDGGWTAFTDATTSSWAKGQGIRVLIRGTKGQAGTLDGTNASPNAVTLDMTGVISTGNQSINLVTGGSGSTAGFNFVGNPYPSPVDIGAVLTAAAANLGSSFYLRNPQTGSYITVNPIPANYIIPAYTGFFVQATSATTLNFTEANKNVCTTCPTLFRTTTPQNYIRLNALYNGIEYDSYTLNVDASYTNQYDRKDDAIKLMNDGLNIYSLSTDKQKLAADYRTLLNDSIVPLVIAIPANYGKLTYTIKVADFAMATGVKVVLHDKLNNTYTELKNGISYPLEIDAANPNSVGENRLELIFSKEKTISTIGAATDIVVATTKNNFIVKYENAQAQKTSIRLVSVTGQLLKTIELGNQPSVQTSISNAELAEGLYIIEVQIGKEKIVRKIIK